MSLPVPDAAAGKPFPAAAHQEFVNELTQFAKANTASHNPKTGELAHKVLTHARDLNKVDLTVLCDARNKFSQLDHAQYTPTVQKLDEVIRSLTEFNLPPEIQEKVAEYMDIKQQAQFHMKNTELANRLPEDKAFFVLNEKTPPPTVAQINEVLKDVPHLKREVINLWVQYTETDEASLGALLSELPNLKNLILADVNNQVFHVPSRCVINANFLPEKLEHLTIVGDYETSIHALPAATKTVSFLNGLNQHTPATIRVLPAHIETLRLDDQAILLTPPGPPYCQVDHLVWGMPEPLNGQGPERLYQTLRYISNRVVYNTLDLWTHQVFDEQLLINYEFQAGILQRMPPNSEVIFRCAVIENQARVYKKIRFKRD